MPARKPVFEPTMLSNCVLWLRADQGVVRDESNNVKQWNDVSGQGNHLTQATGNLMPRYVTIDAAFRSRPTVQSTGTQFMSRAATNLFGAGAYTIASVAIVSSTTGDPFIVANGTGAAGCGLRSNGANRTVIHQNIANYSDNAVPLTAPEVWVAVRQAASAPVLYANNVPQALTNTGSTTLNDPGGTAKIDLFNLGTGNVLTGRCSEIVMFNRALAQVEVNLLSQYLGNRYGIPVIA